MQFSHAFIASILAAVAHSQTIARAVALLPACALTCLAPAIAAAGCSITDYACQCGPAMNAIAKQATPCIAAGCSNSETLSVQKITTEICVLQAAQPAGSSVVSSVSSAATGASSAVSSAIESVSSSVASVASSAVSSVSSAASHASSSASVAASSASGGSTGTSSAPAAASKTGSASRMQAAGAIVGAAALAAFAL